MLPIQLIQESLSISYANAVISRSGLAFNSVQHDYGTDVEVRRLSKHGSKVIDLGPIIEFQLKSSINWSLDPEHVTYDMEAEAYNRYIYRRDEGYLPFALILCCLPQDQSSWLNICEEELIFKKCCYYSFIDGPATENTSSIRIRIPRTQLLTPDWLAEQQQKMLPGAKK